VHDVNIRAPLRHLNLHSLIGKIEERNAGEFGDTNGSAAEMEFAAGTLISPKLVANRQRAVRIGIEPILGTGWLKRYRALYEVEPRDTAGRIVLGGNDSW
jgi:hypothetical protein